MSPGKLQEKGNNVTSHAVSFRIALNNGLKFLMIIYFNLVITASTLYVYGAVFAFFLLIYRIVEAYNNVKVSLQQTYHY